MHISNSFVVVALVCVGLLPGLIAAGGVHAQAPSQWIVPEGFDVTVFAENVENARSLALGSQGTVFVGSLRAGKLHAVIDADGDHAADRVLVIASGLEQPNGVAFRNGALYVATASQILRFDDIERQLDSPPAPSWSATICRTQTPGTRGSSSPSDPIACCTCRSERRATCASPRPWCRPFCG